MKIMIGKRLMVDFVLLLLVFSSCNSKCLQVNYSDFGIDTTSIISSYRYVFGDDTTEFILVDSKECVCKEGGMAFMGGKGLNGLTLSYKSVLGEIEFSYLKDRYRGSIFSVKTRICDSDSNKVLKGIYSYASKKIVLDSVINKNNNHTSSIHLGAIDCLFVDRARLKRFQDVDGNWWRLIE